MAPESTPRVFALAFALLFVAPTAVAGAPSPSPDVAVTVGPPPPVLPDDMALAVAGNGFPLGGLRGWFSQFHDAAAPGAPHFTASRGELNFGFAEGAVLIDVRGEEQAALLRHAFVGASDASPRGAGAQGPTVNYFRGSNASEWRTGLQSYEVIVYDDVWRGVDVAYRVADGGLKYDLLLEPGAELSDARFLVEGADGLSISPRGELLVSTAAGQVADGAPVGEQDGHVVACSYVLFSRLEYGYACDPYDLARPFTVDPYIFSTFLAGGGESGAADVQLTADGDTLVLGATASLNFPATPGAYNETLAGASDIFVAKLAAAGDGLLWATYIGGSADDGAFRMELGPSGAVFLAGATLSADFPTTPGVVGAVAQDVLNGIVLRLNATGAALDFSTYIGADYGDFVRDIVVASDASVYITGQTTSANFTTTAGAFDRTYNGTSGFSPGECFLSHLSASADAFLWSTFLAPLRGEVSYVLGLDPAGQPVVASTAGSAFAAMTTPGAIQRNFGGGTDDVFIQKFSADGANLVWATFLGGSGSDLPTGLIVDAGGATYISGRTGGAGFPTTVGAFQVNPGGGVDDAFLAKVNASGDLLTYSTFLGGSEVDVPTDLVVNEAGYATMVGYTYSYPFPTTPQADIPTRPLGMWDGFPASDGFVVTVNRTGASLFYSTLVGGMASDSPSGVAVDPSGAITVVGDTASPDFTNTSGAYDRTFNGPSEVFVQRLRPPPMDFEVGFSPSTVGVARGMNASVTLVAASVSDYVGPDLTVTLVGAPPGITGACSVSPLPVAATCPFVVDVASQVAIGTYNLTLSATNGTRVKTANLTVVVGDAGDFRLALGASAISILQGSAGSVTVATAISGPYDGTNISVNATSAGPWMTSACAPPTVTPGGVCTLQVSVAAGAPVGTYAVTVSGSNWTSIRPAVRTTTLNLTVVQAPDFELTLANSSVTVGRGISVSFALDVRALGGYAGPAVGSWALVGDPPFSGSCSPPLVAPGAACTFTLSADASAPLGRHYLVIQASNGSATREVGLYVEVVRPADFAVSLDASAVQLLVGVNSTVNVSVAALFGYVEGPVDITVQGATSGFAWSCSPASVGPPGGCVLTLGADSTVLPGDYHLLVAGSNGTVTRTAPLTVSVARPPESLTMQLDATTLEVFAGESRVVLVTLTGAPYFGGLVTVRLVGGAPHIAGVCSPRDVAPTGSCQLTVTVSQAAAQGTHRLTVEGFNGTMTLSASLNITVLAPPPAPDFSLRLEPSSLTLLAGEFANVSIEVASINGYSNNELSVGAVTPAGIQVRCLSISVATGGSCVLRVTVAPNVVAGQYMVEVRVFDALHQHSVMLAVIVEAPPAVSHDGPGALSPLVIIGIVVAMAAGGAVAYIAWRRMRGRAPVGSQAPTPRVLTPAEAAEARRQEEYARLYGKSP